MKLNTLVLNTVWQDGHNGDDNYETRLFAVLDTFIPKNKEFSYFNTETGIVITSTPIKLLGYNTCETIESEELIIGLTTDLKTRLISNIKYRINNNDKMIKETAACNKQAKKILKFISKQRLYVKKNKL